MSDTKIAFEHPLASPIEFPPGEFISTLKFRVPTAGDIVRNGLPAVVKGMGSDSTDIVINEEKMTMIMGNLAEPPIPPTIIKLRMTSNDWSQIAWALVPFFVPMEAPET